MRNPWNGEDNQKEVISYNCSLFLAPVTICPPLQSFVLFISFNSTPGPHRFYDLFTVHPMEFRKDRCSSFIHLQVRSHYTHSKFKRFWRILGIKEAHCLKEGTLASQWNANNLLKSTWDHSVNDEVYCFSITETGPVDEFIIQFCSACCSTINI